MFNRFTAEAREVVVGAQEQARGLRHDEILAEHLLLAVLAGQSSVGAGILRAHGVEVGRLTDEVATLGTGDEEALREIGIDLAAVRQRAEAAFGPGALDRPRPRRSGFLRRRGTRLGEHLPFSAAAKRALEQSLRQAVALNHHHIGVDHVLLGLVADDTDPAARTLRRLGVVPAEVREQVQAQLQSAA